MTRCPSWWSATCCSPASIAPVEQVMYLDAPLREHGLLQAIARVKPPLRRREDLRLGRGLPGRVREAARGVGGLLDHGRPGGAHAERGRAAALGEPARGGRCGFFLPSVIDRPVTDRQVADTNDLDACVRMLEPEDVRAGFRSRVPPLQPVDGHAAAGPRAALAYRGDLQWLGKIRGAARARYRDDGTTGWTSRVAGRRSGR